MRHTTTPQAHSSSSHPAPARGALVALGLLTVGLTGACTVHSGAPRHAGHQPAYGALAPQGAMPQGNVAPIVGASAGARCLEVEVAPGVFRSTGCEPLPTMASSRFAKRFQLPLRQSSRGLVPISRAELPASVDLREQGVVGPIRDQGPVGVCWSMAMSGVADNALLRAGQREIAAPLHLIAQDAFGRLRSGGSSDALTREPVWQYDPGKACKLTQRDNACGARLGVTAGSWQSDPVLVREREVADTSPFLRMTDVEELRTPDELAAALAQGREPYLALRIDQEAWGCRGIQGGVLQDYTGKQSSHAVTLVGYRPSASGRQFLIKNSWGTVWGNGGYAWIEEQTLQKNFQDAFLFQVRDPNGAPFPHGSTPSEPQRPSESGPCQGGTARDLLFGVCLPACAGGQPSFGGLCAPAAPTMSHGATCGEGQGRDALSGQCTQRCPSGLLPVGGVCWLG